MLGSRHLLLYSADLKRITHILKKLNKDVSEKITKKIKITIFIIYILKTASWEGTVNTMNTYLNETKMSIQIYSTLQPAINVTVNFSN